MIKFKTNVHKERFDARENSLGSFPVRLIINDVLVCNDGIKPSGFYYWRNYEGVETVLDTIKTSFLSFERIALAEEQLPTFDSKSIVNAFFQRTAEFAILQIMTEGDTNYGVTYENWIKDED